MSRGEWEGRGSTHSTRCPPLARCQSSLRVKMIPERDAPVQTTCVNVVMTLLPLRPNEQFLMRFRLLLSQPCGLSLMPWYVIECGDHFQRIQDRRLRAVKAPCDLSRDAETILRCSQTLTVNDRSSCSPPGKLCSTLMILLSLFYATSLSSCALRMGWRAQGRYSILTIFQNM